MKLYQTLEDQLKKENNYVTDNGELKKWVVLNKAQNFDEELIGLLLDNADLKDQFFVNVKGTLVFNQNLFIQFLEQKNYLNDSYTQYKNKVGLTIDGKYLKQRNEVALVWPFKDCVLEGGQSREEDKREEIFFNEILAQDEITQLLEPKVLTNAKRIEADTSTGSVQAIERPLGQFNRDTEINKKRGLPDDTITDNLIIKGNNLLALHTLKEQFAGKVKLIYIDPPYNTGNDGFNYNDKFSRSSWLTFMKNRLLEAKEMLSDRGSIFIHCDENQNGYLRVLCDEIFDEDNLMNEIIWRYRTYVGQVKDYFPKKHDTIFWYKKKIRPNFNLGYEDNIQDTVDYKRWEKYIVNGNKIIYGRHPDTDSRFTAYLNRYIKQNGQPEIGETIYEVNGYIIDDVWEDIIAIDPKNLSERTKFKGGQKPEALIERIISSVTDYKDIVLDFHLGSGTTAAVAHKMNRQYIGVEQMDYIETVAVERLKKVIAGEQGGISKTVNWQGGGSFVYLELKKYNQTFIEQIASASSATQLLEIWEQMKAKSFLSYNLDIKKQDEHLEDFKALSLAEQKQHLCELLDKNQLYVNQSSLYDADFACTEEEKKITQDFYQLKK